MAGVVFYVAGVVFGGQQAGPRVPQGASECGSLTKLVLELAPPDSQQPIGCWLWAISVAGVVLYVAGVVFGGEQAGPKVLWGWGCLTDLNQLKPT